MVRVAIPVLFSIATIVVFAFASPHSAAQDGTPAASPAASPAANPLICHNTAWQEADVRPPDRADAAVTPVITDDVGGTPTLRVTQEELYLVVITLPPGELGCMPFSALSNQKNGAIIWMVQQGKVLFAWRSDMGAAAGSTPIVARGNLVASHNVTPIGTPIAENQPVILYPGDWVIQDRLVDVTYRNVGGESAIILKAVYAEPVRPGGGCGGDCH